MEIKENVKKYLYHAKVNLKETNEYPENLFR